MRCLLRCLPLVLAGLVPLAPMAGARDLRSALEASVRFLGRDGTALGEVTPGEPFEVELTFVPVAGGLPDTLRPVGWIRETGPGDPSCGETAAAYRAAGRGALGGVELGGVVIGVLARDDSLSIADPGFDIGSANLVAARRFDARPADMVADPANGVFLLSDPAAGVVRAVDVLGGERIVAAGLDRPGRLVAGGAGGPWVLETGTGDLVRLRPGGPVRLPLDARALATVETGTADTGERGGDVAVLAGDGAARRLVVLGDDGTERARLPAPDARDAGLTPDAALWLGSDTLHVAWLDAPDAPMAIPLGGAFDAMAASPEGRFVLVFSRRLPGFAIVDLALGRRVQSADTDAPVAEAAFLPGTAVLRFADQTRAGVIDLSLVGAGRELAVGSVRLGPPATPESEGAETLLAPLLPEPAMLAVNAPSFTGYVLDRQNALASKPPMHAMRLAAGLPRIVRALDRGFRPGGAGRFVAAARLPRAGAWQLVVSAGVGQMAFCAPVPAPRAPRNPVAEPGRARAEPAGPGRARLVLTLAGGAPAAGLAGELDIAALAGNWRGRRPFATDAAGRTLESYPIAPGQPIVVRVRPRGGGDFLPAVLEGSPAGDLSEDGP